MSLFSVLIPSYNKSELIADAVNSVLGNGFEDFELKLLMYENTIWN